MADLIRRRSDCRVVGIYFHEVMELTPKCISSQFQDGNFHKMYSYTAEWPNTDETEIDFRKRIVDLAKTQGYEAD